MSDFRVERDSMGDVKVPAKAYYGAQTQRAVENFPISGQPLPSRLVRALGLVKAASAIANRDLGKLKAEIAEDEEQLKAKKRQLQKFEEAKKIFETN